MLQYTEDTSDTVEVDLVTVITAGTFASLICIPGMLVFAAAFHPQALTHSRRLQRALRGLQPRVHGVVVWSA